MNRELVHLVIDRAPHKGHTFRVLQFLAIDADPLDIVTATYSRIAACSRTSRRHAQEAIATLTSAGIIERLPRQTSTKNQNVYLIHRQVFFRMPLRFPTSQREFAGELRSEDADVASALDTLVARTMSLIARVAELSAEHRKSLMTRDANKQLL